MAVLDSRVADRKCCVWFFEMVLLVGRLDRFSSGNFGFVGGVVFVKRCR